MSGLPRAAGIIVVAKLFDDELTPFGLLASQLPILAAEGLFGESAGTMSKLARSLLIDRTTLPRTIRPLERARLSHVVRSPDDARTKVVVITRSGERIIESIFPVWERVLEQVKKSLGAGALSELQAQLDQVIALNPRRAKDGAFQGGSARCNMMVKLFDGRDGKFRSGAAIAPLCLRLRIRPGTIVWLCAFRFARS
jgi:DNA-binding MarR family transcriptional regulator